MYERLNLPKLASLKVFRSTVRVCIVCIFQSLESQIVTFVRRELKGFQRVLSVDLHEGLGSRSEDEEQWVSRDAFLKICLDFLRRMQQKELADRLQSSKNI